MAPTTSSLGVGSGLDLSSLLDNLKQSEQTRLNPLQRREASYNAKLTAYGTLQGAVDKFSTAAEKLGGADLYRGVKLDTAGEAFTATGSPEASAGRYQVSVNTLAQAQTLVSAGQADADAQIGSGGKITLSLGGGAGSASDSVDIDISAEQSSLSGIRDAINASGIGVTASIINDGSDRPNRLVLSSAATGTDSQISVSVADNSAGGGTTPLSDLLNYNGGSASNGLTQKVAASNASLSINGIDIQSQSNTVEDAIQGVTLSLTKTTDSPQALNATADRDSVKSAIQGFVDAYNSLHKTTASLTAFNGPDSQSGVLMGDSTARGVENQIRSALNTPIQGGQFFGLSQIGVSLQRDGTMKIDDAKLSDALAKNLDGVSQLLAGGENGKGVSGVLADSLGRLTGDSGLLTAAKTGTQSTLKSIGDQKSRMQDSIDATVARYRTQFENLDKILNQLNSTQSYLSQQFSAMNKSSNN